MRRVPPFLNSLFGGGGSPVKATLNDRGIALPIVLWVLVVLMVIAGEFSFSMRVEGSSAKNFKDEASAYSLALAGMNLAMAELSTDFKITAVDKDGKFILIKNEGGALKPLETQRSIELGEGKASYEIEDEKGKININKVSRETIDELLRLAGVEKTDRDTIADSILDWRDPGHEYHLNGAEDDYYSSLPAPYEAKDADLDTVEELLLVKGMTPDIFYGSGKTPQWLLGGQKEKTNEGYAGIARFLTAKGDGKININTAPGIVLEAALGKGKALEIMRRRETEGFFEQSPYGGTVSSDIFMVRSMGEVRGIRVGLRAILEKTSGSSKVTVSYWNEEGIR